MHNFTFYRSIIAKNNWKTDHGVSGYMHICRIEDFSPTYVMNTYLQAIRSIGSILSLKKQLFAMAELRKLVAV